MQNKPHRLSFILIDIMAEGYVTKMQTILNALKLKFCFCVEVLLDSMEDQWQIYSFDRVFMEQYSNWKINERTQEEFK